MNETEIRKTLDVFKTDNGLVEVRIFSTVNKTDIYSGIFDDYNALIESIKRFDREPYNIYFVFNELKDALNGMPQYNKMIKGAKAVSDSGIKYRRWLLVDFDPIREGDVKDIASTDEEMGYSHDIAVEARKFMRNLGFTSPVVCKSGNGYHLLFRVDNIPCNNETNEVCKNVLKYIAKRFSDERVDCDVKVFNAARITKFYGTMSHKGGNTAQRPHRKSEIVVVPSEIIPTSYKVLEEVSNALKTSENGENPNIVNSHSYNSNGEQHTKFDLDEFLVSNGISVLKDITLSDDTRKIVLKECPFNPEHGKDSAIFVAPGGAITFTCFHQSCSSYTWKDLRLKFDPHAYDRKEQYDQRQYRQYRQQLPQIPQKKKYEIKDELPELGKKWFCMSDIKKVDLSEIESMKTGFTELDRLIIGLYVGEVTIISGNNSSGKSSWINTLLLNIIDQGHKVALWSGELPSHILKTWIQMVAAGKNYLTPSKKDFGKYYVRNEIGDRIDRWMDGKFFLYNNEYTNKWEQIFHDMEELCSIGVKLFVLDNLFSLDIDLFDGDKNNKQKELILQICRFAKSKKVHIMLVAHPRKVTTLLRKTDISGSSDLSNAVDNVFIIHRVNNDFMKAGKDFWGGAFVEKLTGFGNCVEIAKNRLYGIVDKICGMYYEIESRRFKNTNEEYIHYGWEGVSEQRPIQYEYSEQYTQVQQPSQSDSMPFAAPEGGESPF